MSHPFPQLFKLIEERLPEVGLTTEERQMISIAEKINNIINSEYKIVSENLPHQSLSSDAQVVKIVAQTEINVILKLEISLLDKIYKVAEVVKDLKAGDGQQKTFLAFKLAIDLFKHELLSTIHQTSSLRIQYNESKVGRYYLVLNESVICDPWSELVYPKTLSEAIFNGEPDVFGGNVRDFFYLDQGWNCFKADTPSMLTLSYDFQSTQATFRYAPQTISTPSSRFGFFAGVSGAENEAIDITITPPSSRLS